MHATTWILAAVAVTVLARSPFLLLPLRLDEGGLALVGQAFVDAHGRAGGSLYGGMWIDRSPLLIALYGFAQVTAGAVGVRLLGMVAAVVVVALVGRLAARLGPPASVPIACVVAVALTSSPWLAGPYSYPELLASAVVAGCALLALRDIQSTTSRAGTWLAIGALAAVAVLLKQSFMDGIAVGAVAALVAGRRTSVRATLLPFAAGLALPVAATLAWAATLGPGVRDLTYALYGFRVDGMRALQASPVPMSARYERLLESTLAAGLAVLLPLAAFGLVQLARRDRGTALVVAAWLAAGLVGIAGGGYYWNHYMLQLVPVLAVLAGMTCAALPRPVVLACAAALAASIVVVPMLRAEGTPLPGLRQSRVLATSAVVADNRRSDDRIAVLYARANAAYYARVRPAFPYQWSLMYQAMPHVERDLRRLLASPQRPAWLIAWQPAGGFGLDRDGRTQQLVTRNYRVVTEVCGHRVLLRRDDRRDVRVPTAPAGCRA